MTCNEVTMERSDRIPFSSHDVYGAILDNKSELELQANLREAF